MVRDLCLSISPMGSSEEVFLLLALQPLVRFSAFAKFFCGIFVYLRIIVGAAWISGQKLGLVMSAKLIISIGLYY